MGIFIVKNVHPVYSAGIRNPTCRTWISSHNDKTGAPALNSFFYFAKIESNWRSFFVFVLIYNVIKM